MCDDKEPSPELLELIAVVHDLSSFVMGMDAKLELIVELLGGEMRKKEIEPTPEDWQRARDSIGTAKERLLEHLARSEARRRLESERRERRHGFLRRLFPFRRAA